MPVSPADLPPLIVPQHFLCPISLEVMTDPVILSTGITYERLNVRKWLDSGHNTCPVTNQVLPSKDLLSNVVLQRLITTWRLYNHCGSPPIDSPAQSSRPDPQLVSDILRDIEDGSHPIEALARLKALTQENKESREMVSTTRGPRILASVLSRLSYGTKNWSSDDAEVYREALAILCCLSLDDDTKDTLIQTKALAPAIEFLREGELELKVNFLKLLGDLSKEERFRVHLGATEGLLRKLLDLLRQNVDSALIESSLVTLTALCVEKQVGEMLLRWGMMEAVINLLARAEGGVCEGALGLVEISVGCWAGWRGKQALQLVSAVTSSMLRQSGAATECGVRILSRMCGEKRCCEEAVRKGAVGKAVLVLQMSRGERRAAAMELLRLLQTCSNTKKKTKKTKKKTTHHFSYDISPFDVHAAVA